MVQRFTTILIALLFFPALAMAQMTVLQGTVEKIDKNQIVLKTETGQENVELNSSTKGADQAKVGDKVMISASKKGEKLVASSINTSKDSSPGSPRTSPRTSPPTGASDKMDTPRSTPSGGPSDKPSSN